VQTHIFRFPGDHVSFLLAPNATTRLDATAAITLQQVDGLRPGYPA
jgi:hypothetical protein